MGTFPPPFSKTIALNHSIRTNCYSCRSLFSRVEFGGIHSVWNGSVNGTVGGRIEQEQLGEQEQRGVKDGAVGETAALDEGSEIRRGDSSRRKRGEGLVFGCSTTMCNLIRKAAG